MIAENLDKEKASTRFPKRAKDLINKRDDSKRIREKDAKIQKLTKTIVYGSINLLVCNVICFKSNNAEINQLLIIQKANFKNSFKDYNNINCSSFL